MKTVSSFAVTVLLLCIPCLSFSQNVTMLERLFEGFDSSCVCMGFTYSLDTESAKVVGKGDLQVQGTSYHMTGNGLEVFCDGSSSWIIDDSAMEVVIEPAADGTEAAGISPALLLARLEEIFVVESSRDGRIFTMEPKVECGVLDAVLTFNEDGRLRSCRFTLEDGQLLDVRITYIRNEQKKAASFFCPDMDFDSDWVVTDLR